MSEAIAFDHADAIDHPRIYGDFLKSYKKSKSAGCIRNDRWPQVMRRELADILARRDSMCLVAYCPTAERGRADLYGWCIVETNYLVPRGKALVPATRPLVVYVYIAEAYRRRGFARALLKTAGVVGEWDYALSTGVVPLLIAAGKMPGCQWQHGVLRHEKT